MIFQNVCSNFTGNVCLEVYSNKSTFTQVLENNYIDSNGLYSQIFDLYVSIKFKIRLLKTHALRS